MRLLFQTSLLAIACCLTGQAICQQVDELQSTRVKAREPLNVGTNAQLGDYKHKFTTSDRRQELSFRDNTYFFLISQKQDLSKFAGVYRRKDKAKIAALPPTAKKLVTGALSFNQVSFMEILKDGFSVALTSTKAPSRRFVRSIGKATRGSLVDPHVLLTKASINSMIRNRWIGTEYSTGYSWDRGETSPPKRVHYEVDGVRVTIESKPAPIEDDLTYGGKTYKEDGQPTRDPKPKPKSEPSKKTERDTKRSSNIKRELSYPPLDLRQVTPIHGQIRLDVPTGENRFDGFDQGKDVLPTPERQIEIDEEIQRDLKEMIRRIQKRDNLRMQEGLKKKAKKP